MSQSALATYLALSDDDLNEMGIRPDTLFKAQPDDNGAAGYYFNVPDTTPQRVLGQKRWSLGDRIDIPASVLNNDLA